MSSPINKYVDSFKELEKKINLLNPNILIDKNESTKSSALQAFSKIKLINPYILSGISFILIFLIISILKPKIVKKEGKVKVIKSFLLSLVISIPFVIFFTFYNKQK